MNIYHGTSSLAWEKIQAEGLRCQEEADWLLGRGVYFSLSLESAWFYARAAANRQGGEPLVLSAEVPDELIWNTPEDSGEWFPVYENRIRSRYSGAEVSIDHLGYTDRNQVVIWDEDLLSRLVLVPKETGSG